MTQELIYTFSENNIHLLEGHAFSLRVHFKRSSEHQIKIKITAETYRSILKDEIKGISARAGEKKDTKQD